MKYAEFEQAVESMQLCTKVTYRDLKSRYRELSKIYHPDMPNGDASKFDEITKAYKLLKKYMQEQYPSFLNMEDWVSGRS